MVDSKTDALYMSDEETEDEDADGNRRVIVREPSYRSKMVIYLFLKKKN
jgi:hypothetical protein